MLISRPMRILLLVMTALVLVYLYLPLIVIAVLSFSRSKAFIWPPPGLSLHWWHVTQHESGPRHAFVTSLKVAAAATGLALVLGSMVAYAVQRFRFFGRDSVSLVVVLPIALPGIVTGVALNTAFRQAGVHLGYLSVIVAHATFCIVVVFNNVVARLRCLSPNVD